MNARYYLLGCLALAACDEATQLETAGPVVVNFAQPFPATAPDLPGFLPRDWGHYTAPGDTGEVFIMAGKALISSHFITTEVTRAQLDSLQVPRRTGSGLSPAGLRYSVRPLAADSFRLRIMALDTILNCTGPQAPSLRYYRGYYYVSRPSLQDSSKWTVRRLAVANGHITQQLFNPDSLRVRALDHTVVQRQRVHGQLVFTLAPQSRQTIGQVSSYAGLWLALPTSGPVEAEVE